MSDKRHNKSHGKNSPKFQKKGQLTPGYTTIDEESKQVYHCARCGRPWAKTARYCQFCKEDILLIQNSLSNASWRKFYASIFS